MNDVQTGLKCKPNVKRCKRFVFAAHSPLLHPNTLTTKAISHFQADHILTRFVFPPLFSASLLRSRINNLLDSRKKLIAQFQQSGTTHASSVHLDEKHSIITEALSKLDNEFIEKITQLVEDNLSSEKIDITYLSDKMCMSGSTLYRKMKALTGLSTNEYIRKVKMQNAERLLLEGKYNISEIAYKVGMNSTGYFRQCFKDEFGVSPSDYLKLIKQE